MLELTTERLKIIPLDIENYRLYIENHDIPRVISTWGNDREYLRECATAFGLMYFMQQGTPFIYQGEEIGMTNIKLPNLSDYKDIETLNMAKEKTTEGWSMEEIMTSIYAKGRDNARTPMQWDNTSHAGFTTGEPWLPVNPNHQQIHVEESLKDPNSLFYYYKKLIQLRKQYPVIQSGTFDMLYDAHPSLFAYKRMLGQEELIVVCNFYDAPITIDLPSVSYSL